MMECIFLSDCADAGADLSLRCTLLGNLFFIARYMSRVERKTSVSQMVVFHQT